MKRLASSLPGHPTHSEEGDESTLIVLLDREEEDEHSGHNHKRHVLDHYDGTKFNADTPFDKTISVQSLAEGAAGNSTAVVMARNDWSCECLLKSLCP